MSREGKLVKNTIILAIGTFFPKLATFLTLPILTAALTQAEYGTYDLVITMVSLILPAATLQIHSAAFRFLIDAVGNESEKKRIISNIFAFVIPTSVIALIIMYIVLQGYSIGLRLVICAYFFFDIIINTNRQIIRGLGNNGAYALSAFISSFGQIVVLIAMVQVFHAGLVGAVFALAIAEIISSAYLLMKGKIYRYIDFSSVDKKSIKEMLSYSWPMVPNSLSQWVLHASDKLVISFVMSVTANAIFSVAYKIPSILTFAQTTFNMAWQENASVVAKDEDAASYYSTMFKWLFDIVAGCMAIIIGLTPLLFMLLIRGDYSEAYNHIPIIFMGMLFFSLSTFWGGIFVAFKKTKAVGATTVISALIHLIVLLAGIHWFGLYAASVATVVGYLALCVLRLIGVEKIIKIQYDWKRIAVVLAILVVQCTLCFQQNLVLDVINFVVGALVGIILNKQVITKVLNKVKKSINKKKKPKGIAGV